MTGAGSFDCGLVLTDFDIETSGPNLATVLFSEVVFPRFPEFTLIRDVYFRKNSTLTSSTAAQGAQTDSVSDELRNAPDGTVFFGNLLTHSNHFYFSGVNVVEDASCPL